MSTQVSLNHYIVVGGLSWGKAETLSEAFLRWYEQAKPSPKAITLKVRQVDKDAYVDGMGTLFSADMVKLPDVQVKRELLAKIADVDGDIEEMFLDANAATDLDKM